MSYLHRKYPHRYKVLSGPLKDGIFEGQEIGAQDYPDQAEIEGSAKGTMYGVWLNEPKIKVNRTTYLDVTITDEGVNYSYDYIDLCVPFDRYGNEIKVGDTIMVASKNEVRRVEVVAIAKKPYMAGYGIMNRKLTVRDEAEEQTLTINDPRATVKI
jgi:hypothetical protein